MTTGFHISNFSRGPCLYSGRLEMLNFTLTDPVSKEIVDFKDVPFHAGIDAVGVLTWANEVYGGKANSHLDPASYVGMKVEIPQPDQTLPLTVDTPPPDREILVGKIVSPIEVPGFDASLDILRIRRRYERENGKADYHAINDSIRRDDVVLLNIDDLYPQHQTIPSQAFKRFDLLMLKPNAQRLVERSGRVVLIDSAINDAGTHCLWIKDNGTRLPSRIKKLKDIQQIDLEARALFCDRLSFANRDITDESQLWETAKQGVVAIFCRCDLHTLYQRDAFHQHVLDITPYHLKSEARQLMAVAKRVVFANAYDIESPDIPCVWWKGEP